MRELDLHRIRTDAKKEFKKRKKLAKKNLLARNFKADYPNQLWVSDITCFKVNGHRLFFASFQIGFPARLFCLQPHSNPLMKRERTPTRPYSIRHHAVLKNYIMRRKKPPYEKTMFIQRTFCNSLVFRILQFLSNSIPLDIPSKS